MADSSKVNDALTAVLEDEHAPGLLSAYFSATGPFAASSFHSLGTNARNSIGRDDLLAITFMDERVRPQAARQILAEKTQAKALLRGIPDTLALWDATDDRLDDLLKLRRWLIDGDGNPESHAWIGPVIADKLAARKRPALVPIVDRAVRRVVGPIDSRMSFWQDLRGNLTKRRQKRLRDIRLNRPGILGGSNP